MFDFRQKALFCLGYRLSKHKMTINSKNFGGHGPFGPPLGHAYDPAPTDWARTGLHNIRPARAFSVVRHVPKARPRISNCRSRISSMPQRNLYIEIK